METTAKKDVTELLMEGVKLAHQRLLEKAKRENATLVIERDGKIIHVPAREL